MQYLDIHDQAYRESPMGILARAGIDPSTCLGAWDWRGSTEARQLKDRSYSGNDGTNNGAALANGSVTFSGGSTIDLGNYYSSMNGLSQFSAVVVCDEITSGGHYIGDWSSASSASGWALAEYSGGLRHAIVTTTTGYVNAATGISLADSALHICCFVFNGTNIKTYIDNNLVKTSCASGTFKASTERPLLLGANPNNNYIPVTGKEKFAAMLDTALAATQISDLYTILSARYSND